jgi:hypothetical protein
MPNDCSQDVNIVSCYFFGAYEKLYIYSEAIAEQ